MSVVMRPVILLWTLGLISGLLPLAHPASIPQTHDHPTQDLTTLKRDLGGAVPVKEQLVHVTQAILQGAKRFAAAIAGITVPSVLPGSVDSTAATKEYEVMLSWWCSRFSPDPKTDPSFVCHRYSTMEKLRASDKLSGAERENARSKLLAEVPKLPQLSDPEAKRAALVEARQMLQEFCVSAEGSVRMPPQHTLGMSHRVHELCLTLQRAQLTPRE